MTFDEFCVTQKVTPEERRELWEYFLFLRARDILQTLPTVQRYRLALLTSLLLERV